MYCAQSSRTAGALSVTTIAPFLDSLIVRLRAQRALHLANKAFQERYSKGHPFVRPLTPKWRLVVRWQGSRPDRPSKGHQSPQ